MRNKPNCHPRVSSRAAGCGAKRSGPKPRDLFNQHRQRRFQTNPTPPKNAKRTQFQHTQHLAAPYFCETNPIYAYHSLAHDPNMRNEPNLPHAHSIRRPLFMRNEPNPNRISHKSLQRNRLGGFRKLKTFLGELNDEYRTEKCRMSKMHLILFCPGRGYSERLCPVSPSTGSSSEELFFLFGRGAIRCSVFF